MSSKNESKGTKKKVESGSDLMDDSDDNSILKNLYAKNIEVVHKNKTLSLLSKLYEIGILTLEPKELAMRVSQTALEDLSFEIVGIFSFDPDSDSLLSLALAKTERVESALQKLKIPSDNILISKISTNEFFKKSIYLKKENSTRNLGDVWSHIVEPKVLKNFEMASHIKTTLLYPLIIEKKNLGVVMLSINRDSNALSDFEIESIKSFVNAVSLTLEKAYLYEELQHANARLLEQDKQKDELLSMVTHQLATPVSSVKWYTEMLIDGDIGAITKSQREHLKTMAGITDNLSDLVSMILDVSRIQLGRMHIEKQELNLNKFFKEILEIVTPKAVQKKINFNIKIPSKLPTADLDKRYTHMTIENLLSNAIKYTPEGGDVLFNIELDRNNLRCIVKDTGMGIPKVEQSKIFGKMFRASNATNVIDGNGFGLYIAKGAVVAQGGKIRFESEEGKGTTFFVELPLHGK